VEPARALSELSCEAVHQSSSDPLPTAVPGGAVLPRDSRRGGGEGGRPSVFGAQCLMLGAGRGGARLPRRPAQQQTCSTCDDVMWLLQMHLLPSHVRPMCTRSTRGQAQRLFSPLYTPCTPVNGVCNVLIVQAAAEAVRAMAVPTSEGGHAVEIRQALAAAPDGWITLVRIDQLPEHLAERLKGLGLVEQAL
jgi:hypothetical protein